MHDIQSFLRNGKQKEKEFAEAFKSVFFSSPQEDMKEHWDVEVKFKIDVKGLKKIFRSDNQVNENIHWIELKNVNGKLGSLYAEQVDYFAFETLDYWLLVNKKKLQELIKLKVTKEYVNSPELYKLYRRKGRKDVLTLVKTIDLVYICSEMILKK